MTKKNWLLSPISFLPFSVGSVLVNVSRLEKKKRDEFYFGIYGMMCCEILNSIWKISFYTLFSDFFLKKNTKIWSCVTKTVMSKKKIKNVFFEKLLSVPTNTRILFPISYLWVFVCEYSSERMVRWHDSCW